MAFLERNLEQLTHVQRQLMEQNGSLKKEVAIAERKLIARNERIQSLEALLGDSQEKLTAANHRYVAFPTLFTCAITNAKLFRFETQLTAVKERLELAKVGSARGLGGPNTAGGFSFGGAGSRIAKPLRGGGATDVNGGPNLPVLSSLQAQEAGGNKRSSSWFFNQRT